MEFKVIQSYRERVSSKPISDIRNPAKEGESRRKKKKRRRK